jgi:hypothetical protein
VRVKAFGLELMGLETANTRTMIIVSRGSKGMGGGLVKLLLSGIQVLGQRFEFYEAHFARR